MSLVRSSSRPLLFAALLAAPVLALAQERPKLTPFKWSAEINVPDPIACSVDNQGRVFVSTTTRRKAGDLDIREWTAWIPNDQSFTSVEDKREFYHRMLPPGGQKPPGPLTDANHDGSVDWKDLMVPTERIYRLVDSNADGKADQITTFAEDFNTEVTGIAAGVLAYNGSVYSTIAPDLWKLEDTTGSGKADKRESIVHGFGIHIAYAGHDMHGLRVGPDGRIYWTIGDKGVNVTSKEGRHFFYPNEGCVLRAEPDGSHFEVFAHGIRNTQETDFNELGDLFGVDNDADKPGEKERLVYLLDQSDSGWRCGFQFMKGDWCPWMNEGRWQPEHPQQPYFITPPIINSHDGPAGFAYNPGTALAPAWRGWFFLDQFPSGHMNALRLEPAGASWKLAEDVLISTGIMNIGLSWSPDGKLYFADWMGGYPLDGKGAVWNVDVPEADHDALRPEVQKRLQEGFEDMTPEAMRTMLGHQDVRLRKGAQFELARRGAWGDLLAVAKEPKSPLLARLHAIWGLGMGLRWGKWVDAPALAALCGDADAEVRAQTAKILGEGPNDPALTQAITKLISDENPRARVQAALAAGRLKIPEAAAPLMAAVKAHGNDEGWTRHALVTGLVGCAKPTDLAAAAKDADRNTRLAALLALARLKDPAIVASLQDSDPRLAAEATIAIHDDLGIPEALPALAAWLEKAPADSTEPAVRRAVNANFRLGTPEAAARLAAFALKANGEKAVREEALTLLTLWPAPPLLDREDGRYRKFEVRPPEPVRDALQPKVDALLALEAPELRALGLQLLLQYHLKAPTQPILSLISDGNIPTVVRLEGLRLLSAQDPDSKELAATTSAWLQMPKGQQPAALRSESLRLLAKHDPQQAFTVAQTFLAAGENEEQQGAWNVLGSLGTPAADALIVEAVNKLAAGRKVSAAAQLDLLEAASTRSAANPSVGAAREAFDKLRETQTEPLAAYAECLEGGDPSLGREITHTNVSANCLLCHRFEKGSGSEVGPPLEAVASRHDRRYLLESLIDPSAQVVMGYGMVSVTKKNGEALAGTLLAQDAESVRLRLTDGREISIPRDGITAETPAVSVMPPMGAILSKRQVRDVVAYLATLKPDPKAKKKPKTNEEQ